LLQGACFLPDPPIERNWLVLDDDANMWAGALGHFVALGLDLVQTAIGSASPAVETSLPLPPRPKINKNETEGKRSRHFVYVIE
jgi:hypothetical protein